MGSLGAAMKSFAIYLRHLRLNQCAILCWDCFFNRDASLEIDRLIVENEDLKARLNSAGLGE